MAVKRDMRDTLILIKSMRPIDFIKIITNNQAPDLVEEFADEVSRLRSTYYLSNWLPDKRYDLLSVYMCDSGLSYITTKERAEELKAIFEQYKDDSLYEVWSNWYGGVHYKFGINFTLEYVSKMYDKCTRDGKLQTLLENESI